MLLCEDARIRPGTQGKIDVLGLMNRATTKSFPFNLTFSVFLCLTECRGVGKARIVVTKMPEKDVVYVGDAHKFEFANDPLALQPFMIRVYSCRLLEPGLYSVGFEYNNEELERCLLLVEESQ